jgi:WD40 repeat protein
LTSAMARSNASRAVFSLDRLRLATASSDETVRLWDLGTGQEILKLSDAGYLEKIRFVSNGRRLIVASPIRGIRVWDATPLPVEAAVSKSEKTPCPNDRFSSRRWRRIATAVTRPPTALRWTCSAWDFRCQRTPVMLIPFTSGADGTEARASESTTIASRGWRPGRPANERCHQHTRGHRAGRPESGR